ncbi:magnesium transporter [Candidatus Mycoplasma haematominutum]|uniref:Magnesium transporter n=1 Tax=Candidatus Mycoplasma haematominutum 'Birmingham 1' TaxID=1116213 RepID=G8C355_9MOLU|nr:magnesium transporter [Candidatus Mycoplasma haematominutum]CCE66753.1 magnesium transporter [Candidatus Mycoplasma haematominutum 'Birmingham 1']
MLGGRAAQLIFSTQKQYSNREDRSLARLLTRLTKAYELKNYATFREISNSVQATTLVKALEKLSNYELTNIMLLALSPERMGDFFLSFSAEHKLGILRTIRPALLAKILEQLQADQVAELISIVDSNLSKKIIYLSTPQLRKELRIIGSFSHSQVGSIMNTSTITVPENFNIQQALSYLKKKKEKLEIGDEIFVVNLKQEVVGLVSLQTLFFCNNNALKVKEMVEKDFIFVFATDQIGEAIDLFQKYPFSSAAVLNERNQLLGVVTSKDILPEVFEESIDDVYRFYGIVNLEHSYMQATVWEVVKSRLFWLIILLFATTLTTLIIDKFEALGYELTSGLSSAILVPLVPLITDMCGNSGSQTAASIIQSFASNELSAKDFWYVLKKELKISALIGGIISALNFARLLLYFLLVSPIPTSKISQAGASQAAVQASSTPSTISKNYQIIQASSSLPLLPFTTVLTLNNQTNNNYKTELLGVLGAAISSLALFLVIMLSKIVGVMIPYLAHRKKKDPASLTTPVLTTLLDAIGTLIFFSIGVGVISASMNILKNNS